MPRLSFVPEIRDRGALKDVTRKSSNCPQGSENPDSEGYPLESLGAEEARVEDEDWRFDTEETWWIASLKYEEWLGVWEVKLLGELKDTYDVKLFEFWCWDLLNVFSESNGQTLK